MLLTKTTETAFKLLIYLVLHGKNDPVPVRRIASHLRYSPTYLSKIANTLVKLDILRAHRGSSGGVMLSRSPSAITLLEIVEACQGKFLGDYCEEHGDRSMVCAFHQAMQEIHLATTEVLSRWTLADLAGKPGPSEPLIGKVNCRMGGNLPEGSVDSDG